MRRLGKPVRPLFDSLRTTSKRRGRLRSTAPVCPLHRPSGGPPPPFVGEECAAALSSPAQRAGEGDHAKRGGGGTTLLPLAGEGGAKRRMRARPLRASLARLVPLVEAVLQLLAGRVGRHRAVDHLRGDVPEFVL